MTLTSTSLLCCTNKHINNLQTKRHKKSVHALAITLLVHPITRCLTIIYAIKTQDLIPKHYIPSWSTHAHVASQYAMPYLAMSRHTMHPMHNAHNQTPIHSKPQPKNANFWMHILQWQISPRSHLKQIRTSVIDSNLYYSNKVGEFYPS